MINAQLDGAVDSRFEIRLIFGRNVFQWDILPFELVTHPATGEHRHLQLSSPEASIFHARTYAMKREKRQ
jgi:hypothetical protein